VLSRNLLFGLGIFALLAGVLLAVLWFSQSAAPKATDIKQIPTQSILVASRPLSAGTLLRVGDLIWSDVPANTVVGGSILHGSLSETELAGAVTQRAFALHEPLTMSAVVKPSDREFLVAALAPGYRAVSINVDATQSTSGLVLPGDRVDVVLIQNFSAAATDPGHKTVGETVLRGLRIIAVDQTLSAAIQPAAPPASAGEAKMPKTVTLEVTDQQAEALLVAEQLGKIELALRGQLDDAAAGAIRNITLPTWASDVSPTLRGPEQEGLSQTDGSIAVMHGGKTERRCLTSSGLLTCP